MSEHVLIDTSARVLTLTLNRDAKKNALTREMYQVLAASLQAADADPDIRCVVIRAHGDMFSAGNDLHEFAVTDHNPFLPALASFRKPLIAAVQGRAVGIGVTLLLHCDLVYLAEDAQLSTPFVNLALVPEAASSLLLPLRIGHARAFEMFVLGEPVGARQAAEWGIANRVMPRAELHAAAQRAAVAVAARAPAALLATKALMRNAKQLLTCMDAEGSIFATQLQSPEFREALTAFAEKRAPDFSTLT